MEKIGFGGGCHWCTEAVFQSILGVYKVKQGYISPEDAKTEFSEAVIVYFNSEEVSLDELIRVHLKTHKSNSDHSFRKRYVSGIYVFDKQQADICLEILQNISLELNTEFVTRVIKFGRFKASRKEIRDYYKSNPQKPFCERYIEPKLRSIRKEYPELYKDIDE